MTGLTVSREIESAARRTPIRFVSRHPQPKATAGMETAVTYPRKLETIVPAASGAFRWRSWEEQKVAMAQDGCPQGSCVRFRFKGVDRYGITKSNPFFQAGKLWVFICGYDEPFWFGGIRAVSEIPPLSSTAVASD